MSATKEGIEATAAELGLSMTAAFVPWSISRRAGEKDPSLNWKVTLHKDGRAILTTDYTAGCGHAPAYKSAEFGPRKSVDGANAIRWECENGKDKQTHKPLQPELADLLHSLATDADAIECGTFEEWAADLGYDEDSREAERTYRACLEIGLKLRAALGDDGVKQLREAVAEY